MVERALTVTRPRGGEIIDCVWAASTASDDTFEEFDMVDEGGVSDAILSASGTWGTGDFGASHSVDNVVYQGVLDPGGDALALTADGSVEMRGFGRYIKPVLNTGTPTSVIVRMQFRTIPK